MTGTKLPDSTSRVNLASYGTGNPFSIGSGVSIVNRHLGQTAIYGDASQAWTLNNAGTVGGAKGSADSEHSIGNAGGLGVSTAAALTLTNSGRIAGGAGGAGYYIGGAGGDGVSMSAGGVLTNAVGATIVGGAGTSGLYDGGNGGYGVSADGFATITNRAGATIAGGAGGRGRQQGFGVPGAGGTGIVLTAGGSVSNAGIITGGNPGGGNKYSAPPSSFGVLFEGSADSTLTNSGTITGVDGRAVQFGGGNDRLILSNGSVLSGGADGGAGSNVLELERGGSPGTVDGIGTALTDFQTIVVDTGARWNATGTTDLIAGSALAVKGGLTLTGPATLDGRVSGTGTLTFAGMSASSTGQLKMAGLALTGTAALTVRGNLAYAGKVTEAAGTEISIAAAKTLTLGSAVSGSGAIDIRAGSTFIAKGAVGAAETVAFAAKTGALQIVDTAGFKAGISGFAVGDQIDADNAAFKFGKGETLTFVENAAKTEGTLVLKNGDNRLALHLFGQYIAQGFQLSSDGHRGSLISYQSPVADTTNHLAAGGHG